ncbi:hypothetical protein FLP41_08500 [Paracoccus marcusii]|uniref:hypothetical protein n=1 Tax=Paracoccus marcusii TaxID=59779 RepID=UPI002ED1E589|nr:hypothetical protein FLP41_08500 [Paracoccus marcusii]
MRHDAQGWPRRLLLLQIGQDSRQLQTAFLRQHGHVQGMAQIADGPGFQFDQITGLGPFAGPDEIRGSLQIGQRCLIFAPDDRLFTRPAAPYDNPDLGAPS